MGIPGRVFVTIWLLLLICGVATVTVAHAATGPPDRETTIVVNYTQYEWWLSSWDANVIACVILVDHEGLPTGQEIYKACGSQIYSAWLNTPPCYQLTDVNGNAKDCPGYYFHLVSTTQKEKEIPVQLPLPSVWISLQGCNPVPPENFCAKLPSLLLAGEEPLPNEEIIAIHGLYGGTPFSCEGDSCFIPLRVTPEAGVTIEFWADSSYGDSSQVYKALVRVLDSGVSFVPGQSGYLVDVLSTQWQGPPIPSCTQTWAAFPPASKQPGWLYTPNNKALLATNGPYYYLAGRLIAQGVVDASQCSTGGVQPNGYADACGLDAAKPFVDEWQNQFDARIIEVATSTGVPAAILKNLFAQESQFWPGIFRVPYEFGLGQITDKGADAVLLWNESFFEQFCPLVLSEDTCGRGYLHLKPDEQALLRGAYAVQANADCAECPAGVNLTNTGYSIDLFAQTLQASCDQVAQIVYNASGETPGRVAAFEDLWRFTVANYHGGPGCLSYAIHTAWDANRTKLTWADVAARFTAACQGVVPYVDQITK